MFPPGSGRVILAVSSLFVLATVVIWSGGKIGLEALIALAALNGREYWETMRYEVRGNTAGERPSES